MTALLIGLGNSDRGDDGVGLAVARRVAELGPSGVEVVESGDPAALMDTWDRADRVVLVDAMQSNRPPGTVETRDVSRRPLPRDGWATGGTHALGLSAAVELSRALGRLPRRLVVIGVEALDVGVGEGLSEPVTAAVDSAARAALRALEAGDL